METVDGTVWAGGALTRHRLAGLLDGVETRASDLIFGFAGASDPLRDLVPGDPYWHGEAIDFTDRHAPEGEPATEARALGDLDVPVGARLVTIDARLLAQTEWADDTLHAFGSEEAWDRLGVGYGVVVAGELVAEATTGPRSRGMLEMGVATRPAYRRRGLGTLVSRAVARACEVRGDRVWWNANAGNEPSIAIARRIGFRTERRYELVALRAPLGA
jgi:RimJ/RimL family protein N-acetyltransferase